MLRLPVPEITLAMKPKAAAETQFSFARLRWVLLQAFGVGLGVGVGPFSFGLVNAQSAPLSAESPSQSALLLKASDVLGPIDRSRSKEAQKQGDTSKAEGGPVFAAADRLEGQFDLQVRLRGNAELRRDGTVVSAEQIDYGFVANQIDARDRVRIMADGAVVNGEALQLQLDTNQGFVDKARYTIGRLGGRGTAERINFLGQGRIAVNDGTYTTCIFDEKGPDWLLKSKSLELNQQTQQGKTGPTELFFQDTRILAVPFFFFPLGQERQSGFLAPSLESNSRFGIGGAFPYYWNIATNRDATLTPRLMSRRGFALESELRLWESWGKTDLRYDVNPNDSLTDELRYFLSLKSEISLPLGFGLGLNVRRVSDDNYLVDYGRNLVSSAETRLAAEMTLNRTFGPWQFSARAINWQHLLDARNSPNYEQLPSLRLTTDQTFRGFRFEMTADASRFQINAPSTAATGWRTVLNPAISYPIQDAAYFVIPRFSLHASQYNLDRNPAGPLKLDRVLPTFSVDAGLHFERETQWSGRNYLQTLEPRFFYVKTPYRDQTQFPVFADTAAADLNFAQLFAENTFIGNDRIADVSQLTTVLVSRFLNSNDGAERLRFAVGQRLYFSEQKTTISATDLPRTDTRSDLLLTAGGQVGRNFDFDVGTQYSVQSGEFARFDASLRYRPSESRAVNLAYRYGRATNLNQFDVSWRWNFASKWTALGRLNYSFAKSGTVTLGGTADKPGLVEAVAGFEYYCDCWTARVVVHRFVTADQKPTTQLFFQLELNGLGQIGVSPFEVLKRNVPGYQSPADRQRPTPQFFGYE